MGYHNVSHGETGVPKVDWTYHKEQGVPKGETGVSQVETEGNTRRGRIPQSAFIYAFLNHQK